MGDELQFFSPFLYQSVMFVGGAFLEYGDIRTAGYASPRERCKALFERAKASFFFFLFFAFLFFIFLFFCFRKLFGVFTGRILLIICIASV